MNTKQEIELLKLQIRDMQDIIIKLKCELMFNDALLIKFIRLLDERDEVSKLNIKDKQAPLRI